jgi:hypothetical protein
VSGLHNAVEPFSGAADLASQQPNTRSASSWRRSRWQAGQSSVLLRHAFWQQKNDEGMTTEHAEQSAQAVDLGVCVGLAGLEPATERL